jgi:hypothetical protein
MTDIQRSARHCLVLLVALGGWALPLGFDMARAGVVVNTLDQPYEGPSPGEQVGAAIQIGSTPISLTSVIYTEAFSAGPMPGETFAVFSRNADGTVGNSLFNAFTLTYDSTTQNTTALAISPFTLQANTSYWLMMLETPGTFGDWDNSSSSAYMSSFGVTLPDQNASVAFFDGSYTYYSASDGLQLFQLNGTPAIPAIPEPSALTLAATGGSVVLGAFWLRRRCKATQRGPES